MLSRKRVAYWLLAIAAVITITLLLLPSFIDSDSLKAKIQSTIEQQTGGQVQYQQAELSFLPRPSIALYQIKLDFPEQVNGSVDSVRVYPEFWPLLLGQLRLAKLVIDADRTVAVKNNELITFSNNAQLVIFHHAGIFRFIK